MTKNQTMLIVNPSADKGHAWQLASELRPLVEEFGGADWKATEHPLHATALAQQAAESGYKLVIVAGGDGTLHEVINGLMLVPKENRPSLGIVPLGSGNDFANSLGIQHNPVEALNRIYTGVSQTMDVGKFDFGDGTPAFFNNTFGMGFDATVTIRTMRINYVRGFMMYLVAVLQTIAFNHDAVHMKIDVDGQTWEEDTLMLVACNGPREGGGFAVAPDASITDGYLNYASVCKVSRLMMLRLIPEVMNGTHGRFKQVKLGKFHQMQIQSDRPFTVHADGEVIRGFGTDTRRVRIEVVPAAVKITT